MAYSKEPVIQIDNLEMKFGKRQVLNGISMNIYPGEFVGYIGSNASGKSVTLKIMLGLLGGYTGEVRILGDNPGAGELGYKRRIGYVSENSEIYETLSPREFFQYTGELYGVKGSHADMKAKQLMEEFGIGEVYNLRNNTLSKITKQKVLIIASLLTNPEILFYDESFHGLDAHSARIVREILMLLASKGTTVFYSSTDINDIENMCNRIIKIENGRVKLDCTPAELKSRFKERPIGKIFDQLTGFTKYRNIAKQFVAIMQEKFT